MATIKLKAAYGGVTLFTSFMVGQQFVFSDFERLQREASFDNEFMDYHFQDIHHLEIGDDPAGKGYPDDCNGRYAQKKLYPEWYFMNIAKRQNQNGIETIVTMAPLSLLNGLFLPFQTMALLGIYSVGRHAYTQGYVEKEGANNKLRIAGAVMCHSTNITTIMTTLFLGVQAFTF